MLVCWLWLCREAGLQLPVTPRVVLVILFVGLACVFVSPLFYLAYPVTSPEHVKLFTWLMRWGGSLGTLPLAIAVIIALLRYGGETQREWLARSALQCSLFLFGIGGMIGFLISGSNVTIPAHYHGSIVGVTLAMMGVCYILLPQLGFPLRNPKMAIWQPIIYSCGQLLHVGGLVWSGGYGVQRKVAGAAQALDSIERVLGMGLMGLGRTDLLHRWAAVPDYRVARPHCRSKQRAEQAESAAVTGPGSARKTRHYAGAAGPRAFFPATASRLVTVTTIEHDADGTVKSRISTLVLTSSWIVGACVQHKRERHDNDRRQDKRRAGAGSLHFTAGRCAPGSAPAVSRRFEAPAEAPDFRLCRLLDAAGESVRLQRLSRGRGLPELLGVLVRPLPRGDAASGSSLWQRTIATQGCAGDRHQCGGRSRQRHWPFARGSQRYRVSPGEGRRTGRSASCTGWRAFRRHFIVGRDRQGAFLRRWGLAWPTACGRQPGGARRLLRGSADGQQIDAGHQQASLPPAHCAGVSNSSGISSQMLLTPTTIWLIEKADRASSVALNSGSVFSFLTSQAR